MLGWWFIVTKKIRNNPNGNLEECEFIRMIHTGEIYEYLKKHNLMTYKCPPYKLISSDTQCTYCMNCFLHCIDSVKEKKDHYLVGKVKYMKKELEDIKEEW